MCPAEKNRLSVQTLSSQFVSDGELVPRGELIGYSGDVGSPGSYHLHFEVQKNGEYVDPYGWQGSGDDPYTRATNFNLWYRLPDTGQTLCYDNDSEEPCPPSGQPFHGQDAQYVTNPQSYTQLDASGADMPFSEDYETEPWAMVRDNNTGLIWEVKTDDGSVHDKDNMYTWQEAQDSFIVQLNAENFGGFNNWRLPTVKELSYLIDIENFELYSSPAINTYYFPLTIWWCYWSITESSVQPSFAWLVDFGGGFTYTNQKSLSKYARAVRDEQFSNSFTNNSNWTIIDGNKGLMWEQKTNDGGFRDKDNTYTWEEALVYCENLILNNDDEWTSETPNASGVKYNDWRLPNINELKSIVDYNEFDPAIDPIFSNTKTFYYWSSTTDFNLPEQADLVSFYSGDHSHFNKLTDHYVRCVRGGLADADADGILDDGDKSGVIGDNQCSGGQTENCDDNCIEIPNPDQIDTDSDGDGVIDTCDNCPDSGSENRNPDQLNSDHNKGGDVCDPCPADPADNCNPSGSIAGTIGTSGGTLSAPNDSCSMDIPAGALDSDTTCSITNFAGGFDFQTDLGDVYSDYIFQLETGATAFSTPALINLEWTDGSVNEADLFVTRDNEVITTTCDSNTCSCTTHCTDCSCDLDANYFEIEVASFSQYTLAVPLDSDGDGVVDNFDGVTDNCPDDPNPEQTNSDTDTYGDACDNCWYVDNPDQLDSNGNCPDPPYDEDKHCGDACDSAAIPTLSEWGVIILMTIMLAIGGMVLRKRRMA